MARRQKDPNQIVAEGLRRYLGDGRVEHTGGNIYVVAIDRADGHVVVVLQEGAFEYESRESWENGGEPINEIHF